MSLPAELARVRDWATSARPVFVVGPPRSGTSMLLLALGRHPALFPVKKVFETFIFHRPQAPLVNPVPGMLRGYLGGDAGVAGLRQRWAAVRPLAEADAAARQRRANTPAAAEQRAKAVDDDLLRVFFHHAAESVYGQGRVLEKTPGHLNSLPRIFRIFPQARVLACVRDPVEILRSYRMRLAREQAQGKPEQAWAWLTVDESALARQLVRARANLEQAGLQWPGQVFQVPYAWITGQPRQAMIRICEFLGEPFDERVLGESGQPGQSPTDPRLGRAIGEPVARAPAETALLTPEAEAALRAGIPVDLPEAWAQVGPLGHSGQEG